MDHLQLLQKQISQRLFGVLLLENAALLAVYGGATYFKLPGPVIIGVTLLLAVLLSLLLTAQATAMVLTPLKALWQLILHLSPTEHGVSAPDIANVRLGRELLASLSAQVYQLADISQKAATTEASRQNALDHNFVAQNLPLPLLVLDNSDTITFANTAAAQYIGGTAAELVGKNVYMVLDMLFPSEDTFDHWLKAVKTKNATAVSSWERVRLNVRDNHPTRMFDLAAYYNRSNPNNIETMLVLFDHTKQYSQDDQAISFIALSVHELRTPLTLLRGYIEVFEEELGDSINGELKDFMLKMHSQAEQLTAFVNNILNVARIDDDQLQLQLHEEDWNTILKSSVEAISLRAKVRGITLHCSLATNLPTVGVDRLSIREVINNIIDNAIKYSGDSKVIEINSHLTQDGLVETTVQDFGMGISTSIMPNLFTKFYRDHRNRAQIGGTGLGLYLSKAIITAHGGNLWVRSKENEGSTFGFTLQPYSQLTEELKRSGNQEITRGAHGWIKNHSLYRR